MKKILISAYACSPYQGSEPGVGWNFVKCLSKYHELHILTESKFQKDIEKYFVAHPEEKKYFNFYFIEKNRHKKLRKIWPPSYYWFYRQWQKKALTMALELNAKYNFDIVHQLNMGGYREPGYLYKLNKPFVWGPVGGMCISPWKLLPSMGFYGAVYYFSRNIINLWQMRFKRRVRKCAEKSDAIIVEYDYDGIKNIWNRESVIMPEVGLIIHKQEITQCLRNENLKICWSGMHIPGKSLNLLLESLRIAANRENIELHVIGAGECTKKWKLKAKLLNLKNIKWHGWVQKNEAINITKKCHIFCITSLSDGTPTVLLEALSSGLPVIALDHCGFSNVITEKCGVKIPVRSKKQVVSDFAKAIDFLFENDDIRVDLARGALLRAKDFAWDKKAETINAIYDSIIHKNETE
ncbi:MAG: glycosyltransferase [Bacteroidales bacterium]|jgi:glycosyltransferase involved in cell wall biosynthesis|nr:glycosyltransferase [Bacteroidales bacterium]